MLKDILTELAATTGLKVDSASQRDLLVFKINKEAKELYENAELHNSLREQVFELGTTDQLVTLPWYVWEVRALRGYEDQLPIHLVDMRPKYQSGEWDHKRSNEFRLKQQQYPLCRDFTNESRLRLTFAQPLTRDLTVTVTGKTFKAERVTETITFQIGNTEKWTDNSWADIESFKKSSTCNADLNIYDVDGNLVSEIANCNEEARYTLLQVLEKFQTLSQTNLVLILYKTAFIPFQEDTDSFPCGDIYDRAIYWKTLANIYTTTDGKEGLVETCIGKVNEILVNVAHVKNSNLRMRIDFGYNRFRRIQERGERHRFSLIRDGFYSRRAY